MDQLRWILLAIGALVLLGLALFEARRRQHAAEQPDPLTVRQEPVLDPDLSLDISDSRDSDLSRRDPPLVMIDELDDVAGDRGFEVVAEVAVDRPGRADAASVSWTDDDDAGAPVQWPPLQQDRILWLRVAPQAGQSFNGRALRLSLTACGLFIGPQDIFHRTDAQGHVLASAANLVRPGSFDLAQMDGQTFRGVHVFAVLPSPLPPPQLFDELVALADELAARLSGVVQDEQGVLLDDAKIAQLHGSLVGVGAEDHGAAG
jgi:cell division protein ZipA